MIAMCPEYVIGTVAPRPDPSRVAVGHVTCEDDTVALRQVGTKRSILRQAFSAVLVAHRNGPVEG